MTQAITNQAPPGKPPATQALNIRQLLASPQIQERLAKVASTVIDPTKLAQALLLQVNRNADLQKCTAASLLDCLMVAAQYGWTVGGPRPGMYLIPYGTVATPIPSYFGLQQTARDCADEWEIEAEVVREGDKFVYAKGLHPQLEHQPYDEEDAGVTHAYAIARSKNGRTKFEVMPLTAIEAIRSRSRAAKSGPWVTDWAEMAKKTVVRRLCKYLPSSPRLDGALSLSDDADGGRDLVQAAQVPVVNASYAAAKAAASGGPDIPPAHQAPVDVQPVSEQPAARKDKARRPGPKPEQAAQSGAGAPAGGIGADGLPTTDAVNTPAPQPAEAPAADGDPRTPEDKAKEYAAIEVDTLRRQLKNARTGANAKLKALAVEACDQAGVGFVDDADDEMIRDASYRFSLLQSAAK